ncbi:hypothetical protein PYCCODRAFT_182029 [Trametes coccinea BRFM310]|uniref:Uncharacterized protein n=1 Tax=Trametes coccinea (strain BRFM310) TaxID=1353009 RepID=A0A1Y2ISN9_TRAC3|nr:hypothetical protein PYCCODRAFT_182029 [Trametes coccinea BRFM310]
MAEATGFTITPALAAGHRTARDPAQARHDTAQRSRVCTGRLLGGVDSDDTRAGPVPPGGAFLPIRLRRDRRRNEREAVSIICNGCAVINLTFSPTMRNHRLSSGQPFAMTMSCPKREATAGDAESDSRGTNTQHTRDGRPRSRLQSELRETEIH